MIKDGGVFDENVTINVAAQTATFYVPSRKGADEANVVHDFRKVNSTFAALKCYFSFSTLMKLIHWEYVCEYCIWKIFKLVAMSTHEMFYI